MTDSTDPQNSLRQDPAAPSANRPSTLAETYAPGKDVPLGGYATLVAAFGGVLTGVLLAERKRGHGDGKIGLTDIALMGLATHRITRVVARDWVTAPVRAPFTQYEEEGEGGGEVVESARGTGLRKAIGELVTCRFCVGPWVAMGLVASHLFAPRTGRALSALFSVAAISDFLHNGFDRASQAAASKDEEED